MVGEAVAALVVFLVRVDVVMEGPGAARLADQMADVVLLAGAEAPHAAVIPPLVPFVGIDAACRIQRRAEFIADGLLEPSG